MYTLQIPASDSTNNGTGTQINHNLLIGILFVAIVALIILFVIANNVSKNRKIKNRNDANQPQTKEESKPEFDDTRQGVGYEGVNERSYNTSPKEKTNSYSTKDGNKGKIKTTKASDSEIISDIVRKPQIIIKPTVKLNPHTIFVTPESEDKTKIKQIGYTPNDLFYQEEPLNFPYVVMPVINSNIKFPRKNKIGNKGYTEDHFFGYINRFFKSQFRTFNDRILIISSKQNPYEPDIAIIDEDTGMNLFMDIEIDEPYDGISREPMHFTGYDYERNKFFRNRGWLTIRFAEKQVWQHPESCCKFICIVICTLNDKYIIPPELDSFDRIEFIPQWSFDQAKEWAQNNYREKYLGIDRFLLQGTHKELEAIAYNELEEKIEKQVNDNDTIYKTSNVIKYANVKQAINTGKYISCKISQDTTYTILRPELVNGLTLSCFCYLKNRKREININDLDDLIIRDQPFIIRINGDVGIGEIKSIVNDAIRNNKIIRIKYTRSAWTEQTIDRETGEIIILNQVEAEESIRTITNIDYSINILDQEHVDRYNLNENYITAYCHRREEQRTFRFDRISELEILNI